MDTETHYEKTLANTEGVKPLKKLAKRRKPYKQKERTKDDIERITTR